MVAFEKFLDVFVVVPLTQVAERLPQFFQEPRGAVARGQLHSVADDDRRLLDLAGLELGAAEVEGGTKPKKSSWTRLVVYG
jgi:hypothetical protein